MLCGSCWGGFGSTLNFLRLPWKQDWVAVDQVPAKVFGGVHAHISLPPPSRQMSSPVHQLRYHHPGH